LKNVVKNDVSFIVSDNVQFAYFWDSVFPNQWEDFIFHVMDHYLQPDKNYLDIGAWIGPTALYAANKAKHTFSIDPDHVAFSELQKNIQLNPSITHKITAINQALSYKSGTMKLYKRTQFGDSSSSLIRTLSDDFYEVTACTLKELLEEYQIRNLSLIKMDIEGGEYMVIPSMREYLERYKPPLHLSLHPTFLKSNLESSNLSGEDLKIHYIKRVTQLVKSLDMYTHIYYSSGKRIERIQLLETLLKIDEPIEFLFTTKKFTIE
jgi:FkbM family methyltransferase